MIYTYEPELKVFYDYSKTKYFVSYPTNGLNINDPKYNSNRLLLKYHIVDILLKFDTSIKKSELKVVTYIDLITQVAGVPSFLFIIAQFTMKNFENFYSDL